MRLIEADGLPAGQTVPATATRAWPRACTRAYRPIPWTTCSRAGRATAPAGSGRGATDPHNLGACRVWPMALARMR